ncbi:WD repeat-containing protein on Y chromosome [Anopheles nili]|uniref:WD repeat-containing protein on Y chromosome n=1 Tax=Anopheles nili TaxID=185578 RepID=UPI00237A74A7|nr:WD repeat-containing protein on Y chromosome [Anopheles nili]
MAADSVSSEQLDKEIHRFVTREQIEYLYAHFRTHNGRLSSQELRELLGRIKLQYTEEEYRTLWLQINTDHDEYCQWDEFLSYLILGFQDDDPLGVKQSIDPPIAGDLALKLRRQVYTIVKVDFCPMVYYDGSISWSQGHWITTSREGVINYWTEDWKHTMTIRSVPSKLKRCKTWVLDSTPLPDLSMLCVASLETELRFYHVVAGSFSLKLVVERLPHSISALAYRFNRNERSQLLTGDYTGRIRMFVFYPERKVTTSSGGSAMTTVSLDDVLRGKYPPLECVDYGQLLPDIVQSVQFVDSLACFIAAAEENPLTSGRGSGTGAKRKPCCSMVIHSLELPAIMVKFFHVPHGVTCFAFEPANDLLVSGGPDGDLRLWDINRPKKPLVALVGHTSSITFLFIQDAGDKIYSFDQKKIIKVWDVRNRTLLQTFSQFSTVLGKGVPACAFYNARERELTVAGNKLFVTSCCPEIALDRTDGESHTKPVSVLLYNALYRLVISCGFDSFIIVWDHRMNRKMSIITKAHTQTRNRELDAVEITAGCFDEKQQLLLTGARDGSMKIWNISGRFCMRTIQMAEDCEVTAVFWQANRIIAMGWNHRVVEFAAFSEHDEYPRGLQWRKLHSDDILCASVTMTSPAALATCSYAGELVFWKLETGQPYRRYDATSPLSHIPVLFHGNLEPQERKLPLRQSIFRASVNRPWQRRLSGITMPSGLEQMRRLSYQDLMFLASRPMVVGFGTLLGSLNNGMVQVWSHHPEGGFMGQFSAIHMAGDRVIAMASDRANKFLFTGTALGYVKTWYIEDCWIPDANKFHVNKPAIRVQFPFLLNDVVLGRAKRSARAYPKPWLVNSYQAHRACITGLAYLDDGELLLSCSSDRTVRIWTLGGRYIGLLGSPVHWEPLVTDVPPRVGYPFRLPPDLQREVSFTTAKVLRGGQDSHHLRATIGPRRVGTTGDIISASEQSKYPASIETYGAALAEPILNASVMKLPAEEPMLQAFKIDKTFPSLPLHGHMTCFPVKLPRCTLDIEHIIAKTKRLRFAKEPDPPSDEVNYPPSDEKAP